MTPKAREQQLRKTLRVAEELDDLLEAKIESLSMEDPDSVELRVFLREEVLFLLRERRIALQHQLCSVLTEIIRTHARGKAPTAPHPE